MSLTEELPRGEIDMKLSRKYRIMIVVVLVLLVSAVIFFVLYRDYSDSHELLKLSGYTNLTIDAEGREAEDAIVDAIAAKSRFGRAFRTRVEKAYRESMAVFEKEAEYFRMELGAYIEQNYDMSEEEFRQEVRKTTEQEEKRSVVLHEIAEREKIVFTDEEFETVLPFLMEAYGYSDEQEFALNHDYKAFRDSFLQEKVLAYLVKNNTIVNAKQEEPSEEAGESSGEAQEEGASNGGSRG